MSELLLPLRIYIEDTDAGRIVYHANYLKYFERARTEFMRAHGFGKGRIFNTDLMFVVHSLSTQYLKPAYLDDEIVATAKMIKLGSASIIFEQQARRGDELLCRAEVCIACVDKQRMRPQRIPAEIVATLSANLEETF
jgi:tol-pal system-associated acyl-CoA thioesterase